ncbi:LppM family (lipo)protein [Cutibacterium namnetense]|uniref:LppM domain-containing protein n=2 Tax=Cutibacterium namnetense TaxID=1574624 RepID=A0ABX9IEM4_9ACTN|nr:hypothetical protein [Cutibacterium namnetense]EGR95493.1 putative lipoprotein [ [[Propionibacterium] namnetense SK182B-JCVI]REB70954.1 hypothetical protein CP880_04420 [Cutibacterium namnetense]TKW71338.1 MAG: hypothetical protein DI580_08695 [Cutibacterium acnes]
MLTTWCRARYLLAVLLAPLVLLSGCGKFNAGFVIKDEDHIDVAVAFGVLKSGTNGDGSDQSKKLIKRLRGCSGLTPPSASLRGKVKAKPFDDGTYAGCTITGTVTAADIAARSPRPSSGVNPSAGSPRGHKAGVPVDIAFDDETIRFHFDGSDLSDSVPGVDPSDISDMAGIKDFKVSVTFPGTVLSHSGSSKVDGNTATWTDVNDLLSTGGLTASGKSQSGLPGWVWVVGALVVLAIGGAVAAVIINNRWQVCSRGGERHRDANGGVRGA